MILKLQTDNRRNGSIGVVFLALFIALIAVGRALSQESGGPRDVAFSLAEKEIGPNGKIEIRAHGNPKSNISIVLNDTDLTDLFELSEDRFVYEPKVFDLQAGENHLKIFSISAAGQWLLIKELKFKVAAKPTPKSPSQTQVEFTPTLTLNFKGERNVNFFPLTSRPERLAFMDSAGQGGFQLKVTRGGWALGANFDIAGSSRRNEALRFGELGERAPSVDLASYRVEIGKGRFKAELGHVSYGSQRHLINSFSSRGLTVTVPAGKQNEIIFSALNGTSIVGYDNFAGLSRADHQLYGVTFAREFIKERPGGLRFEVTAMRGSLLPLNSFNERTINDAEKSFGGAVRLLFKDKEERLRFEGGFTLSRFTNRSDPSLEQGLQLTQIRPVTRDARFIEASFDFIQGLKLFDDRKLKITGTYRHEEIAPLFKSITASAQADRRQNQFEVSASWGDLTFIYGNLRDRDNLNDVVSILKTLSRRNNISFAFSPGTLLTPSKPIKYLPRISYTYDHVHQFGAFTPTGGLFNSPSQVPDQDSFAQAFNAELPLGDKFRISYKYNRAFQDNKQPGRDRADLESAVNALTFSIGFIDDVQIGIDLSHERQKNFEGLKVDRQFRLGSNLNWQNALIKNSALAANISTIIAGDAGNTTDSENIEFDLQWSYRLDLGKKQYRKMSTQFFVRYANRHGFRIDRPFAFREFNRFQGFNMGLSFSFF
ncbi:MAG: hypothetical protein WBD22_09685 [Pyrinomonadaceae bacterium]